MRIFLSSNAPNLETALSEYTSTATVEAEYGDRVVEGSVITLAHHGPRQERPCPCSLPSLPDLGIEAIGVSHFDLDTLGGVMSIMGKHLPYTCECGYGEFHNSQLWGEFWQAAAHVDVNGVHKCEADGVVLRQLQAFWAWSEANRLFPPRDGSVADVSGFINDAIDVIDKILRRDEDLLASGDEWAAEKSALAEESFVESFDGVDLRQSEAFVNHLYGPSTRAIVGHNTQTGAITVSVPEPIKGFFCGEFLKDMFGPEAGGHAGIGGTPRGQQYSLTSAMEVAKKLARILCVI